MSRKKTWPLERVLFALAGTVTLVSAVLAALVSSWFVLRRACRLRSVIYDDAPAAPRAHKATV
jgi:hypothetical protein